MSPQLQERLDDYLDRFEDLTPTEQAEHLLLMQAISDSLTPTEQPERNDAGAGETIFEHRKRFR